jgi:hypothetical protein
MKELKAKTLFKVADKETATWKVRCQGIPPSFHIKLVAPEDAQVKVASCSRTEKVPRTEGKIRYLGGMLSLTRP